MQNTKRSAAVIADACARLINLESASSISKLTGMAHLTLIKMVKALQQHGLCRERKTGRSAIDAQKEARLHELFKSTDLSNRSIVARTGVPLESVNRSRRRFNAAFVKAGGELPKCDCGQYLHHSRMCKARLHQHMIKAGVQSVHTLPPETRADVSRRLVLGETVRSIAERLGLKKHFVQSYLCTLSAEEREVRGRNFRTKAGRRRAAVLASRIARPHSTNPANDPLYERISQSVPRGIDRALRDDMISQAYLDYLDGRLDLSHLAEGMKKVRGKIFKAFANPWGMVSLDEIRDEGDQALIDRIPSDVTAFA